ncbi:glycosyltransferase [Solibacillus isronensis]|uniref:glycosyltransferase n=1 Tax=Solibacillus isronensis TaxID=412383 RepID=UPI00399F42B6
MDFINELKDGYSTINFKKKEPKVKPIVRIIESKTPFSLKTAALATPFLLTPTLALADTFGDIHNTVMTIFDGGVVLIIIFAGASWALGHRSKAIELLIGVCCGYLLARHAIDIRDYLKSIG